MDNPPPTLARGLARSLYNDVERLLDRNTERLCSNIEKCKSKKLFYNSLLNSFDKLFEELIVDKIIIKKTGKHANCIYVVMATDVIPGRITLDLVQFKKCPPDVDSRRYPGYVTRHCIERMFQRLHIQQLDLAIIALRSIFNALIDLHISNKQKIGEFEIACSAGLFLGEFHEGKIVLKTFVDEAKLRPEQKILINNFDSKAIEQDDK